MGEVTTQQFCFKIYWPLGKYVTKATKANADFEKEAFKFKVNKNKENMGEVSDYRHRGLKSNFSPLCYRPSFDWIQSILIQHYCFQILVTYNNASVLLNYTEKEKSWEIVW